MKKNALIIFLSLLMLTLFTWFVGYFPAIEMKPDVILILIVYIAISSDNVSDIFVAFMLGYFFDVFSGSSGGLFAMLRTVTFVVARYLNMNFFSKNLLFFVVTTFIISIFDSIYLGYQFSNGTDGFWYILKDSIYISIINALTALFMYRLFTRIERFSRIDRRKTERGY